MEGAESEWKWPLAAKKDELTSESKGPSYIRLHNLLTDEANTDTLHQRAADTQGCSRNRCLGSLMQIPNQVERVDGLRPKKEVMKQAKEFLAEYYASMNKENTEAHLKREADVFEQIQAAGLYELTEQELTYGARLAWRNSPRCIGRIQWSNLQLIDRRQAMSAQDMYDALIEHIKYGTNKGNLRSTITVFPPRRDAEHDFRVWNIQLIRYAGYKQEDGSVIGDPANVEFTRICESLGWRGKGGRFDVLPLLLQANGRDPQLFEIPPELALQVPITHPEYDWFEQLDLKWYALPAVSCLLLDVGGVEFPACPFNGWYMVTEIAARDFGDTNRYNLCKPVAERLKLDTRTEMTLWRDRALVELNRAVMHSFLRNNVTIVDHHAASNSFMQHLQNEQKLRGGCPADWVWVVPPISGSATKVFHQEMLYYKLKPCFEYQEEPWKAQNAAAKWKFKDIVKFVMVSNDLMGKALAKRIKVTILYATETGNSERYAKLLKNLFDRSFDTKIICMEDYDVSHLDYESLILVVTSTFGNAEAPHNGEEFGRRLHSKLYSKHRPEDLSLSRVASLHLPRSKSRKRGEAAVDANNPQLLNARFSVFALGSRAYGENFCAFGRSIDSSLSKLGAERISPLGEGDELCGQEESFRAWAQEVFHAACETFCIDSINQNEVASTLTIPTWSDDNFRLAIDKSKKTVDLRKALTQIHSKNIEFAKVLSVTNLQSPSSSRSTILVKLGTETSSSLQYCPGDHLSIFPSNQPDMVEQLLEKTTDIESSDTPVRLEYRKDKHIWIVDTHMPVSFTLREAFARFIDITTPPTPQFLQCLIDRASNEKDRERLSELATGSREYEEWKFFYNPTIIDVIEQFPSLKIPATLLISKLPRLKQRHYSISSSTEMFPNEIHITVSVVNYQTKSGKLHHGVCSTWLNSLREGDEVPCITRAADNFRLPQDPSKPIILIGPGTGIAPFRSFWQQRAVDIKNKDGFSYSYTNGVNESMPNGNGSDTPPLTPPKKNKDQKLGEIVLFFGCRESTKDDIYKHELEDCKMNGVLGEVYKAYSREPNQRKQYVQDLMKDHGDKLLHMLLDEKGHIYVCGDVSMASDVLRTLQNLFIDYGIFDQEDAIEYTRIMKETGRYHEDIFGITLRTGEVTERVRKAAQKAWVMIRKHKFRKAVDTVKGTRMANLVDKLHNKRHMRSSPLDRGISVDVVMRTEEEVPEQQSRSALSRIFSMPSSEGPTSSISSSFSGEHLAMISGSSIEDNLDDANAEPIKRMLSRPGESSNVMYLGQNVSGAFYRVREGRMCKETVV